MSTEDSSAEKNEKHVNNTINKNVVDIVKILKAISNESRLQIINAVLQQNQLFAELRRITNLSKTALAHHLDQLQEVGLVIQVNRGTYGITKDGGAFLQTIALTYLDSDTYRKNKTNQQTEYIESIYTKRRQLMKNFECKIVELDPMKVVSIRVISKTPEDDAWKKMKSWAEPLGLLNDLEKHPVYGFNNPNPTPGKEEYGYEFWIKIEPDMKIDENIETKQFEGGLFAVAPSKLIEDIDSDGILKTWKNLITWVNDNEEYEIVKNVPCLEKARNPDVGMDELILDLYEPIRKI
ncbi:MAG: AraC family transcriptional regulator [Candidatus Kariarchaeaceae archaeon]|jgi:DNA-binding transcriptional ArsR family regulator